MKGENGDLAQKVEVLRKFLEHYDFNRLRAESEPELVQGKRVKFTVWLEKGKPRYEMKVD